MSAPGSFPLPSFGTGLKRRSGPRPSLPSRVKANTAPEAGVSSARRQSNVVPELMPSSSSPNTSLPSRRYFLMRRSATFSASWMTSPNGQMSSWPTPRTQRSTTESSGLATNWWKVAPIANTPTRMLLSLPPVRPDIPTSSRNCLSPSLRWRSSWAKRPLPRSSAVWLSSPKESRRSFPYPTGDHAEHSYGI